MKISAIPPVSFRSKKNSQNIHSLIFSDNDTDGFIKSNKNIMIVNEQGDIVGKYHKNDFGHYAGFLVIRTTLNQNSDFLEELESVENSNCLIEKNLKADVPASGVLVCFEQFKSCMTGMEMTGITFFDLKDGKRIMHISQKGYNIPTPQNIEDYMLLHEKQVEEYKTKQKRCLSASQIVEKLQHIRKMIELEKHKNNNV